MPYEPADLGLLDGRETAGVNGGTVDDSQDHNQITGIDLSGTGMADEQAVDYLFAEVEGSDIFGTVWRDFNDDGEIGFGEVGIDGVTLTLSGTNDRGSAVNKTAVTSAGGSYLFSLLRPGTYTIAETQPDGFDDGQESLGEVTDLHQVATPAADAGELSGNDTFAGIRLVPGSEGDFYNFGERPQAAGTIEDSVTAGIGFWHNKNGEALIRSLNGGPDAQQLGQWLGATFPNMYGEDAYYDAGRGADQDMDLRDKSNAEIAEIFQYLHKRNRKTAAAGGPPKLDAQVLALALATYVTSESLAGGNVAASYGFSTSADGIAYTQFNVLETLSAQEADDLGLTEVMDGSGNVTILDLLLATDRQAPKGLLYDLDGSGSVDDGVESLLRKCANRLYSDINEG
jgi:hypothetical protein